MAMKYFHCYYDYERSIRRLTNEQAGKLYKALYQFAVHGEEAELGPVESFLFDIMSNQIRRDQERYDEKCRRLAENAQKRWQKEQEALGCNCMQEEKENKENNKENNKNKEEGKDKGEDKMPLWYPRTDPAELERKREDAMARLRLMPQ